MGLGCMGGRLAVDVYGAAELLIIRRGVLDQKRDVEWCIVKAGDTESYCCARENN